METEVEKKSTTKETHIGVMNAGSPAKLYSTIPCTIGYSYIRFEVNGSVRACCVAKYTIGDLGKNNWRDIWRSTAYYLFRAKMMRINKDRFHLSDPEYMFCQQCSHIPPNVVNANRLGL
jgi:hypothetical protein